MNIEATFEEEIIEMEETTNVLLNNKQESHGKKTGRLKRKIPQPLTFSDQGTFFQIKVTGCLSAYVFITKDITDH